MRSCVVGDVVLGDEGEMDSIVFLHHSHSGKLASPSSKKALQLSAVQTKNYTYSAAVRMSIMFM